MGRVSSASQSKADRQGLPEQRRAAYAYAERHGFTVTADFEDVISGASESRPSFYELLAQAREFSAVIVAHTDRIARDAEIGLRHMRLIREAGLELHSATRGLVETGLASGVEMLLSEEERKNIYRRTTTARIALARKGELPNFIQAYGYTSVKRKAVIIPHEAALVRRMFELSAAGLGYIQIAATFHAEAIPTPRVSRGEREECLWSYQTVARIVKNPIYKGEYVWRHTGHEYQIPIASVVPPELWAKAQKARRGPPAQLGFALSGHIFCGLCGARLSSRREVRAKREGGPVYTHEYYRCNNSMARVDRRTKCTLGHLRRNRLEPTVDAELRRVLTEPDTLRRYLEVERPPDPAKETERAHLQREDTRWLEAFRSGAITPAELGEYRRDIKAQLRALDEPDRGEDDLPLETYRQAAESMTLAELVSFASVSVTIGPGTLHLKLG